MSDIKFEDLLNEGPAPIVPALSKSGKIQEYKDVIEKCAQISENIYTAQKKVTENRNKLKPDKSDKKSRFNILKRYF